MKMMLHVDKGVRFRVGWDAIRSLWQHLPNCSCLFCLLYSFLGMGCAPMQMGGMRADGSPWLVQAGGLLHQADGYVLTAENGPLKMSQIVERPDGTQVVKQISSDIVTYGAARLWSDADVKKDTNAKDVQINKDNNDLKALESNNAKDTTLGTFTPPQ